jgi:hypothetical protein
VEGTSNGSSTVEGVIQRDLIERLGITPVRTYGGRPSKHGTSRDLAGTATP